MTIPILAPKSYKQMMLRELFEILGVERCYMACSSTLPLRSVGKATGVVVDGGHSGTWIVPVYENVVMTHQVERLMAPFELVSDLGGSALVDHLVRLMNERGYRDVGENGDYRRKRLAERVVHNTFFVSMDPDHEEDSEHLEDFRSSTHRHFTDARTDVTWAVGNEQFQIPEYYFHARLPREKGKAISGLHSILLDVVRSQDAEVRKEMFANIVLAGACMSIPGMLERLIAEVEGRVQHGITVNIQSTQLHSHFKGATHLVREIVREAWMDRFEYDEFGPDGLLARKSVDA